MSKHSSKFFHHRVATPFSFFSHQALWLYSNRDLINWGKNHDIWPISGLTIYDCWSVE